MLDRFLPQRADNAYRGHKLALWIFAVIVFMRLVMSLNSALNAYTTARYADGIPLDTYPFAAEQTTVYLFSLLGMYSFILCIVCLVVLIRYRSLVPAMFSLLLLQSLAGRIIPYFHPIVRTGTPPGIFVNLSLLAFIVVGLALSLRWQIPKA